MVGSVSAYTHSSLWTLQAWRNHGDLWGNGQAACNSLCGKLGIPADQGWDASFLVLQLSKLTGSTPEAML